MAYNNQAMPQLKLIHGVQKTIINPVSITGNGVREVRRKQNRSERFAWRFPSRSISQASKQELYSFFRTTDAALQSFSFQDPDYPEFNKWQLSFIPYFSTFSDTNHPYYDFWLYELPYSPGHPLYTNPYMYDLVLEYRNQNTGATVSMGSGWCDYITTHNITGQTLIHIPDSWAFASQTVGVSWMPNITGPCYLVGRLNSPISWTISAMDPSPIGTPCTPTPSIVDMGDIEIIEVFEGL